MMTKMKFNPEVVLQMLKEVKVLADKNQFSTINFQKKYRSFYSFSRLLYKKGILKKTFGREEWVSIEPNIIMAKEILRLYNEYNKDVQERRNKKIKSEREAKRTLDSLLDFTKPEASEQIVADSTTVDANKQDFDALVRKNENLKEHLEAKQEELEDVYRKYQQLKNEFRTLKTALTYEQTANQVYKEKLKEAEKGIDGNVKMLLENIDDYKITISDLIKENKSLLKKPSVKTNTKKIRLFGIPIFSIEN